MGGDGALGGGDGAVGGDVDGVVAGLLDAEDKVATFQVPPLSTTPWPVTWPGRVSLTHV